MAVTKNLFESVPGGVTLAKGFSAAALSVPVKNWKKPDLGLIVSDRPCSAAGTFTTNRVKASSVVWSRKQVPSNAIRALVVNSGNANACTGVRGARDNRAVAKAVAAALDCDPTAVLTASTGVIGRFLPVDAICAKVAPLAARLQSTPAAGSAVARAIMTTDTVKKETAVKVRCGRGTYAIGGCTKGSGMIHPNMATMLGFITTDAAIETAALNQIVKRVVAFTFNNLTIDGDTSTNDMALVLANGASGKQIRSEQELVVFEKALFSVCNSLCAQMAADGEGASRRIQVTVTGGASCKDAARTARAVAASNLVKTAVFGCDPNWGRIVCAIGYSGSRFSKKTMTVAINGVGVFASMHPLDFDKTSLAKELKKKVVCINIDLGIGEGTAVSHTCDLTYEYIRINAEYTT